MVRGTIEFGHARLLEGIRQTRTRSSALIGGEEHKLLALLLVGHGDDRMGMLAEGRLQLRFDRIKRHHFAGDLGEALGAAENGDEAFARRS